jgi:hypothetical protein
MPRLPQSELTATFTAPPFSALVDASGMSTTPFRQWLNLLYRRFGYIQTSFRLVTGDTTATVADCTLWAMIQTAALITLPDPTDIQGQIFYIKNDVTSTAAVSFAATLNRLIDNAAASTITLTAGQMLALQADGTNWIVLCYCNGLAGQATGTNSATPSGGGTPVGPTGIPTGTTPIPAGTPVVSALPNPATSTIGQTVIFNGYPYVFTADPSGGPVGFWAQASASSTTLSGTHAARAGFPAANYPQGSLYYETDTTVSYMVQFPGGVATWLYYNGVYQNTLANIPVYLGVNDVNFTFQATDYFHSWIWNGSAWNFQPGSGGFYAAGSYAFFAAPSFVPFGLWHAADGGTYAVAQNDATTTNVVTPNVSGEYLRR